MTSRAQMALLGLLLAYSAVHFAVSGVQLPLASRNIRQIAHEIRPLNQYLADGQPVTLDDPRQYGPVFFLVMHPLVRLTNGEGVPLSRYLYALQLAVLALAFVFCAKALLQWVGESA